MPPPLHIYGLPGNREQNLPMPRLIPHIRYADALTAHWNQAPANPGAFLVFKEKAALLVSGRGRVAMQVLPTQRYHYANPALLCRASTITSSMLLRCAAAAHISANLVHFSRWLRSFVSPAARMLSLANQSKMLTISIRYRPSSVRYDRPAIAPPLGGAFDLTQLLCRAEKSGLTLLPLNNRSLTLHLKSCGCGGGWSGGEYIHRAAHGSSRHASRDGGVCEELAARVTLGTRPSLCEKRRLSYAAAHFLQTEASGCP